MGHKQTGALNMSDVMENRQDTNESFDLIVGGFLKCPKGRWLLDDVEIATGPDGVRATLLLSTSRHGCVRFDKSGETVRPIVTGLKRFADCDPSRERLPNGLSPYTITQGLIGGELFTFAASSWGARKSFKKVIDQHRYVHPREFPIVTLGTRLTGDANDNVAPTFKPVAWIPISDFAGMLAPTAPELPKPSVTAAADEAPPIDDYDDNLSRTIDDSIPF
jgi:hypothetical protein